MPKGLTHEQIAQRFVDAKAFDFSGIGKLIGDLGPSMAVNDEGLHGVIVGKFSTIACMIPAAELSQLLNLRIAGLAAQAIEGGSRQR